MLRSLPRAANSCLYLRPCLRTATSPSRSPSSACTVVTQHYQTRPASTTHAISNPTLADIEKRWEVMPPEQQAELWMALRDRMKIDWHQLTIQEKKASYWIAFGPHGPRKLSQPGEAWIVVKVVAGALAVSVVLFVIIRAFAGPAPKTMSAQYQEMTNEYLRSQKVEPITGLSSEGYKGKGMVQSKPRKGGLPSDDDE